MSVATLPETQFLVLENPDHRYAITYDASTYRFTMEYDSHKTGELKGTSAISSLCRMCLHDLNHDDDCWFATDQGASTLEFRLRNNQLLLRMYDPRNRNDTTRMFTPEERRQLGEFIYANLQPMWRSHADDTTDYLANLTLGGPAEPLDEPDEAWYLANL